MLFKTIKLILALFVISPILSFSSPMEYDLEIYGTQNIFGATHYVEYEDSNFWEHHYYDYTNGYDACYRTGKTCLDNPDTHVGIDYGVNKLGFVNKVYSYGYGKITQAGGTWGEVTIQNLVNSGKYYRSNLLHSTNIHASIIQNRYITKHQYIGNKGHAGMPTGAHLHLEVTNDSTIKTHVAKTATTYPCTNDDTDDCKDDNNSLRNSNVIDGLISHYDNRDTKNDIIYYNPIEFAAKKKELIPFLSRSIQVPSYRHFDVYGISDKNIYGFLNINSTKIDKVAILAKDTNTRIGADSANNIYNSKKYLVESTGSTSGIHGASDDYVKGDYLFIPYIEDGADKRYGYPVKFSFVDEGSFIIDNDKPANYIEYLNIKAKMENSKPVCDNNIKDNNITITNEVPGYFLTSKLAKISSKNYCDNVVWKVPNNTKGKYKIYAHIPKGATATRVHYIIHTKSGDKNTSDIDQTEYREGWVELGEYALDNIKEYELDANSYVKLSFYNTNNNDWIAFDAIKFVSTEKFVSTDISYPDTKNLDDEYKVAIDYLSNTLPIFSGYKDGDKKGYFGIGDNISRAEVSKVIASMLTHIMKESEIKLLTEKQIKAKYTDWSSPDWFIKYAQIVVGMNIMTGYFDEKKLKPENDVTYRELSKMLGYTFFHDQEFKAHWYEGSLLPDMVEAELHKKFWHQRYYNCFDNDGHGYTYIDDSEKSHTVSSIFKQPNTNNIPGYSYDERTLEAKREDVALFLYRAYMLWKNQIVTTSCVVDEEKKTEGWGL